MTVFGRKKQEETERRMRTIVRQEMGTERHSNGFNHGMAPFSGHQLDYCWCRGTVHEVPNGAIGFEDGTWSKTLTVLDMSESGGLKDTACVECGSNAEYLGMLWPAPGEELPAYQCTNSACGYRTEMPTTD